MASSELPEAIGAVVVWSVTVGFVGSMVVSLVHEFTTWLRSMDDPE